MYPHELKNKLNVISKRFEDPVYSDKFFSEYNFARLESAQIGLELTPDLYYELRDTYQTIVSTTRGVQPALDNWMLGPQNNSQDGIPKKENFSGSKVFHLVSTVIKKNIVSLLYPRISVKFSSRYTAGEILADQLKGLFKTTQDYKSIVIIGIAKGGIPIADVISRKLDTEFSFITVRKIRLEHHPNEIIGSLSEDGFLYINHHFLSSQNISMNSIAKEVTLIREEIRKSKISQLKQTMALPIVRGKVAVVVDDGSDSGASMIAAIRSIKSQAPSKLIVALPIASKSTAKLLMKEAQDDLVIINVVQDSNFRSIGHFYKDNMPVTNQQIIQIIVKRR